ncbi:hypothetical protein SEA_GUUELAD_105 [Mycobacterium phage GuuelaD]|uniref:Uncharacterized protein n=1 Tax=Mycobacterium phage GuuelaD TaxID=2015819 RepID=A0A286MQL1_9CAUD|nr:hypothetical protein J4T97_gp128 [Mycobacterium phage GuuelaD]ASW31536.1 hypothetical protein SEA_GUUELAD_105 [Mycobacterium phage GuuelaD]
MYGDVVTTFAKIMDALHEAEMGARLFDGERLRRAAATLSGLASSYPPDQCQSCGEDAYFHDDVGEYFHREDADKRSPCRYGDGPVAKLT